MKTYEKIDNSSVIIRETKPVETVVDIPSVKREIENIARQISDLNIRRNEMDGDMARLQAEQDALLALITDVETEFPEIKEVVKEEKVEEEVIKE